MRILWPVHSGEIYLAEASRAGKGPSLCWCCLAGSRTVNGHGLAHDALSCHGDLHAPPKYSNLHLPQPPVLQQPLYMEPPHNSRVLQSCSLRETWLNRLHDSRSKTYTGSPNLGVTFALS